MNYFNIDKTNKYFNDKTIFFKQNFREEKR